MYLNVFKFGQSNIRTEYYRYACIIYLQNNYLYLNG